MKRVAVFIDGSNFYNGLRDNIGRMDVDFHRFGEKMAEMAEGGLLRIYYYNARVDPDFDPDNYEKQQRFITHLAHTPISHFAWASWFTTKCAARIPDESITPWRRGLTSSSPSTWFVSRSTVPVKLR